MTPPAMLLSNNAEESSLLPGSSNESDVTKDEHSLLPRIIISFQNRGLSSSCIALFFDGLGSI
jgi:hypothetical protein